MTETGINRGLRRRVIRSGRPARGIEGMRLSPPDMSVEVKNFGPIAKGKVDIRPLTVFAGPSNTGKSWLATFIYALGMFTDSRRNNYSDNIRYSRRRESSRKLPDPKKIIFPDYPENWLQAIDDNLDISPTKNELNTLKSVACLSKSNIEDELCRCYGVPSLDNLIRKGGKTRRAAWMSASAGTIVHDMVIGTKNGSFSMDVDFSHSPTISIAKRSRQSNFPDSSSKIADLLFSIHSRSKLDNRSANNYYASRLAFECLSHLYREQKIEEMHFLPADRGGIMHAHAAVVNALIGGAARAGIGQERYLPVLTGVLSDFMERLVMTANMRGWRNYRNIEKGLNDNILRGSVDVKSSEIGYPRFVYNPTGWSEPLQLTNASSMVSEIGPVSLYLRYFVKPGDLLIFEEPEAHLHPALQRKLIQEIAKWVDIGIHVLITTHSEWVLEELSTIVARSKNKAVSRWKPEHPVLECDKVGVWKFDFVNASNPEKGTEVNEIEWDDDEGGYEAGFYNVMVDQWNEYAQAIDES